MGLCKCPKKKVTNLFCFKHRVNVCEHCLVSNHNKCIVQSYLQWLQDSDYNPNCSLCIQPLDSQDTVRLVCYDLFHWSCLNELASHQPLNTAPDGYQCPTCQGPVFPPRNLASPVADMLREQLSSVNWARAGLGLPLIEDPEEEETTTHSGTSFSEWSTFETTSVDVSMSNPTPTSLPPHQDGEHIYNNREQSAPNNTVFNMVTTSATDTVTISTGNQHCYVLALHVTCKLHKTVNCITSHFLFSHFLVGFVPLLIRGRHSGMNHQLIQPGFTQRMPFQPQPISGKHPHTHSHTLRTI
ncbi:zinc finger protein-like 1 isoform X2 [Danio rerio]|uniref:Zinc finger protein-like 1 isoform X2 n=1 Tax=Danio rerio TaxID=7955 RepID=A0AC58JI18_DANRE